MKNVLTRLMGDRAGGVMMEYVILAVMVAAAVIVAVMYFSGTIRKGFNTVTQAAAGESGKAATSAQDTKSFADEGKSEAAAHHGKISDKGNAE